MSRATNSFDHIRVTAEDADAHQKSDTLRASITNIIEVLAEALEGTIAQDEVERAITGSADHQTTYQSNYDGYHAQHRPMAGSSGLCCTHA